MNKIVELIAFVKGQETFHKQQAQRFEGKKFRQQKHLETADRFHELAEYLRHVSQKSKRPEQLTLSLTPADIEGLPEELLNELSISETDKTEFALLGILEENGGTLSLDQMLVKYYRHTGEIIKRVAMNNRIYRMAQKGLVYPVPGRKGIYSLRDFAKESDEPAESLEPEVE